MIRLIKKGLILDSTIKVLINKMVTQGVKTIILIVEVILVIASIILVVSAQPTVSGCNWNITTNYLTCTGDSSSPCCAVATNFNAITGCVPSLYQKKCTFSGSNSTYCCDSCLQSLAVCVTSPGYQL